MFAVAYSHLVSEQDGQKLDRIADVLLSAREAFVTLAEGSAWQPSAGRRHAPRASRRADHLVRCHFLGAVTRLIATPYRRLGSACSHPSGDPADLAQCVLPVGPPHSPLGM